MNFLKIIEIYANQVLDKVVVGLDIFANNILTKPEFFVGILVFIGYLLLGKPVYKAFSGFIKATVGYMILNVGAGGLVVTFRPILAGLNGRFNLDAAVIDPYFGLNAVNSALDSIKLSTSWTMIALLIGFALNIVLVLFRKFTKIRTLFITGHIMVQQATTASWLIFQAFPQYRNMQGAIMIGVFVGVYWAVGTNLIVGATQRLTNGAGFVVGHQQMFAIWATDKIAPKLGDEKKRLGDLKLPEWLSIFHDNIVATGTLMILFFGTILTILGESYMRGIDPSFGKNLSFVTYIVSKSLLFSVYLAILMTGVKMFVSELTESFQGISNKILPGAMPAVDCAAVYPYGSPNAVLFGFIFGALGQFLVIAGLLVFKSPILIITGFVPVFFDNATIAIFAEKRGGVKAAMILPFISGILQVALGAVAVLMFKLQGFGGWHGNIDQSTLWVGQGFLINNFGMIGYAIAILFMLMIPVIQYKKLNNSELYFNNEAIHTENKEEIIEKVEVEEVIEKQQDENLTVNKMIKLLAVCGNGMGTSMMMKLKAKGILDKHSIQNSCDNCSIGQAKSSLNGYDIVISSVHLASQLTPNDNVKIIALKNILDVKEMEARILEALK